MGIINTNTYVHTLLHLCTYIYIYIHACLSIYLYKPNIYIYIYIYYRYRYMVDVVYVNTHIKCMDCYGSDLTFAETRCEALSKFFA